MCEGDWKALASEFDISAEDLDAFLDYAATFLSNIGNYYVCLNGRSMRNKFLLMKIQGSGDQKFVPAVGTEFFKKLIVKSSKLKQLYEDVAQPMLSTPPFSLGFPSRLTQSSYYPESPSINKEEIALVSKVLEERSIFPENTRIKKIQSASKDPSFEALQASIEKDKQSDTFPLPENGGIVHLVRGDHSEELKKIVFWLSEASIYAANTNQVQFITEYIDSFTTGNLETYRDSQRTWIRDMKPQVENIFGFVEPYRDPYGTRAEFEGLVAISNPGETKILTELVENSAKFIRRLPWVNIGSSENEGKGPFEKTLFEPSYFSSIHGKSSF